MKKILTILILAMLIGSASAASTWYPRTEDYTTAGDINADNAVFTGDVNINGTLTAGVGPIADGVYDSNLRLAANHSFYSTAGSGGIDWSNATGTFKTPTGAHTLAGNVTISGSKTFTTGTGAVSLAGNTTVASNKALAVTTADKLTVGGVIVPQKMIINVPINTSDVDRSVFIADDAWQITKIEEVHVTAQNTAFPNTGSVTVTKCTGTTAPGSGTAMHNATSYLNGSANTVVTPNLTGNTPDLVLADGNRLGLNFNGTMSTFANGLITIHMKRV